MTSPASSSSRPSVSAMVLTCAGREEFFRNVTAQIRRFVVPVDEIIVEEGPEDVGTKRMRALERAHGDIVVMLDDDDWHHPERIEKQVRALVAGAELVGTTRFFVHDTRTQRTTYSRTWRGADCMPAGSMAFWRVPALDVGFFPPGHCAELAFQRGFADRGRRVVDLQDPSLYVHFRHGGNISPDDWCLVKGVKDVPDDVLRSTLGPSWVLR